MSPSAKFAAFDFPDLGFSQAVRLESLVDGKIPLLCDGIEAVPGGTLLPGPKLTGMALKRALAEGGGALPSKLPALIVIRNVVLNIERSETNGSIRSITVPALESVTLPPIQDLNSTATLGTAPVKLSSSLSWTYYAGNGEVRPRYLTMRDVLGTLSMHNPNQDRIFEISSGAFRAYGEVVFAEELYGELIIKSSKEGEEEMEVEEVQLKFVFAKCVSEAQMLQICCHLGRAN